MSVRQDIFLEPAIELQAGRNMYVIPMKERKRVTSIKILPKALKILDTFSTQSGLPRSRLIAKLAESVASAVFSARYRVKAIVIAVLDENGQLHFGTVFYNPDEKEVDQVRRRIYRALLG